VVRTRLSILGALASVGLAGAPVDIDCSDVLGRVEISTVLEKRKEVRIRTFFEALAEDGYSVQEREFVADIAGIANPPLGDSRASLSTVSELPPPPADFAAIAQEQLLDIRALVAEGRLDELAARATKDPSLVRSHFSGHSLAALSVLQPSDTPVDAIDRLIAAGFEFGLHELAFAIAHDVPAAIFEHLLDSADTDLAASWTDGRNNRAMDLAGLAAAKSRLDLLDALLLRGPDPKASRAMDYLPVPSDAEETAAASILKRLAAAGYRPRLPSTADRLRTWVPDATLASLPLEMASPGLTPEIRAVGERFQREVRDLDAVVATTRDQEAQCQGADAGESADPGSLLAKRGTSRGFPRNRGPSAAEAAALFKRPVSDRETAEARQMLALNSYVPWPHLPAPRWDEFVGFVEDLPQGTSPRVRSSATRVALSAAPYDVLVKTLALAGGLPDDAVQSLAMRITGDAVEVLKKLGDSGLDLHYVNPQGMNAVGAVVRTMVSLDVLDYLLDNGVALQPDVPGFDALDYVLLNLITQPEFRTGASALPWVRKFIDHGLSIEASHLQLMELLRLDRPDAHAGLVGAVPELAGRS